MKRTIFISLYFLVILLILSTNQFKWFRSKPESKPVVNETQAAVPPAFRTTYRPDPHTYQSWALQDSSPIDIQKAWTKAHAMKRVVVAVIDTGIDYNHPDLKDNLWKNPKEIPNNGVDDDKNGFVDDIIGWDFVNHDALPYDDHGHGTHVSGIIGAVRGNGIGISGIAPSVKLMVVKYYSPKSSGQKNLQNTIKSFRYAIENGADIINYSGGGAEFSKEEHRMIELAHQRGILVIAAAGNERQNADVNAYYPASYELPNIVSVAALTAERELVESSNYGISKIDVAAPGHQILSTLPNNKYGYMTGTSQATAFITGIAALALAQNPLLTAPQLKALLLHSISPIASLQGKIKTGGVVSANRVLSNLSIGLTSVLQ